MLTGDNNAEQYQLSIMFGPTWNKLNGSNSIFSFVVEITEFSQNTENTEFVLKVIIRDHSNGE